MPYFIEEFHGHVIRIGPDAHQRPDPYIWAVLVSDDGKWLIARDGELIIPLAETGEFQAVSTTRLNSEAVKAAIEAARSLGFEDPHWLHKEKIMSHKHAPHPHHVRPDGTLDQDAVKQNMAAYNDAVQAGKVQVLAIGEPLPVPGMPGVSAKVFLIKE